MKSDREKAIIWARCVLAKYFMVLDTETTGLNEDAEACQVAILNKAGQTVLNVLLKPAGNIPRDASRIHGITNEAVKDAPNITTIYPYLCHLADSEILVLIYNASFDIRIIQQSLLAAGIKEQLYLTSDDVMGWFAKFYGDWNDYHQSYRWQKLTRAATYFGLDTLGAHGAEKDALLTLRVVEEMAACKLDGETKDEQPTDESANDNEPGSGVRPDSVPA